MNNIDWNNAPSTATHYGGGKFWRMHDSGNLWELFHVSQWYFSYVPPATFIDHQERPQTQPKPLVSAQEASNKYSRQVIGLDGKTCQIDVYRVLAAFDVDSHPVAHAIKKLLAPGMRHAKSREQDLREAIASIEAELLMMEQSNE